jgi:hypothetical protein
MESKKKWKGMGLFFCFGMRVVFGRGNIFQEGGGTLP